MVGGKDILRGEGYGNDIDRLRTLSQQVHEECSAIPRELDIVSIPSSRS